MKRKAILMLSAALLAPVLVFGTVAAENGSTSTTTNENTTTTDTSTSSSGSTTTTEAADDKGLQERLTERKTELKIKLTTVEQKHLQTVCKNAQGKATSTEAKVKGLETSRTVLYKNLVTKLTDLSTKLQAKNVDVTQLNTEIASLQTQIQTFNTDMAAYKQDVTDLVAMDCNSDPAAFKASLQAARTARDKALADSTAIKAYVNNTIKPTLQQIRDQLAKTEGTSDSESGSESTKPAATSTTTGGSN